MTSLSGSALKDFLDSKVQLYNNPSFISADPISIPHSFIKKQDIEIAGFFAAIFSWGNRTTIINKSRELLLLMDNSPHDFCINHSSSDLKKLLDFKHRTFNPTDLLYFISFFRHHYRSHTSLEQAFFKSKHKHNEINIVEFSLNAFYQYFFSLDDVPGRTAKHIACPDKKSTCKRLNMFLRWMVRRDSKGVDFGIWRNISPSQLICPVDVHVARVSRSLQLLQRSVVDWQAAIELTRKLKEFDPEDPVKYDFALFGMGVTENYKL